MTAVARERPGHSHATAVVTGGAGFIGSHVVDALIDDGASVVVIDDLSAGSSDNLADEATLEVVDISDRAALDRVIDAARPSVIHHLGAQASVTVSVSDPERDCDVNVHGTLNVLLAATRHGAPMVFTSTGGALYGNHAPIPTSEDSPPAPISPYGASKWAAEAYVNTWREATGLPHTICRLGNVYGPRQSPHGEAGVVAIFSHLLWRGRTPKVYG
jgi:UDP-glucose 4-epimerase